MRDESISVVIPCFNEEARISPTINRIWEYLEGHFKEFEILVIDDGSVDKTTSRVGSLSESMRKIRLLQNDTNMGKGFSIRKGVLASSGDLILISDADLSTPVEEAENLLSWIDKGYDIAIGSRGLKESAVIVRQPWYRENMGRIFNLIVRTFVIGGFKDTQCGFKLFKAVAKEVFRKGVINGFSYDIEMLLIAKKMGYSMKEVPVIWFTKEFISKAP